jgi:hypothetical protein
MYLNIRRTLVNDSSLRDSHVHHSPMRNSPMHNSHMRNGFDALLWTLLAFAILACIPIGAVSGDGLSQSNLYATGTWHWNPNHLLYEPLGAWWQQTLGRLQIPRTAPDTLKLLSILSGAVTLGIFRRGIAGYVAANRRAANVATLWVAMLAAYAALWISDETQMVQMPFLALTGAALLHYLDTPSTNMAAMVGGAAAIATLFYVSHALLVIAVAGTVLLSHRQLLPRRTAFMHAAVVAGTAAVVGLVVTGAAWQSTAPEEIGLIEWLTSYGGGHTGGQFASSFGIRFTPSGIAVAGARAVYGSALALVDITPSVDMLRFRSVTWDGVLAGVACLAAGALCIAAILYAIAHRTDRRTHHALMLAATFAAATLVFAFLWNNSDDQFYFQLAIPTGALIAASGLVSRRSLWTVAYTTVIAWNAITFVRQYVLYPRWEYANGIATAVRGADMILYPGRDELWRILYFVPADARQRRVDLATIVDKLPRNEGLAMLRDSLTAAVHRGERIDIVGIADAPLHQPPWKHFREIGYTATDFQRMIDNAGTLCQRTSVGPFSIRTLVTDSARCVRDPR